MNLPTAAFPSNWIFNFCAECGFGGGVPARRCFFPLLSQPPACNGAPVTEFRLEWGAAEGSMQVCYSGSALSHEMKGLLPATNYFCRIQVSK